MWIAHDQLDGKDLEVYAEGSLTGVRNARASINALSADNRSLRSTVEMEMTVVSEGPRTHGDNHNDQRQRYYNWKWDADVGLIPNSALDSFCTTSDCKPTPIENTMHDDKEIFCVLVMERILHEISSRAPPTQAHLHKYWQWMQKQVASHKARIHGTADLESLKIRVKEAGLEGELLVRVAESLDDVLGGKTDALEMLFADNLLEEYYRLSNDAPFIMKRAMRYIDAMAHKNPSLRILEIGAGTGGLTNYAMETLTSHGQSERSSSRLGEYMFTDISPSFFGPAKERFGIDSMQFKVCDIEKDPELQDFEADRYDLILGSMVLHATRNLKESLAHARKLLKPGGKLILYEIINPSLLRIPFVFGLLPGWWRSVEPNRQWSPLITTAEWHDVLRDTNFSGVEAALSNHADEKFQGTSALFSTALPTTAIEITSLQEIYIVVDESSKWQAGIAEQLKESLGQFSGSETRLKIISIHDLMSINLANIICVSLVELEISVLAKLDEAGLKLLQKMIDTCDSLLWLTGQSGGLEKSPEATMSTGLARVVRIEREGFKFVTLDIGSTDDTVAVIDSTVQVLWQMSESTYEECETEYARRDGRLCISRVIEDRSLGSQTQDQTHKPERFSNFATSANIPCG